MSWNSKVIWSEGLFLRPQHFQQHDRYLEALIDARSDATHIGRWGIKDLQIDRSALALGKFSVAAVQGIFPDGTPFSIPAMEAAPTPLSVTQSIPEQTVYLTVPLRRVGAVEACREDAGNNGVRYGIQQFEVADSNAGYDSRANVEVGKLRLRWMLENQDRGGYVSLAVARIREWLPDKGIVLDEDFLPPCLDCGAVAKLAGMLNEAQGLLHQRAEALASLVAGSGQGGVAEIADFLMLLVLNRNEPLLAHLGSQQPVHPETLYRALLQLVGELNTFSKPEKRPGALAPYRHDDLRATFVPLMQELRNALSWGGPAKAQSLTLEERQYGVRVATIADRTLLQDAVFVLAVNANLSPDLIRSRFPAQAKVAPVEYIRQLVNSALPGIGLRPLPVAPRQIPYHTGFTYFQLDKSSQYWQELGHSAAFAIHVAGEFPGLELEFWAIRG